MEEVGILEIIIITILLLFNTFTVYKFIFNSVFKNIEDFKKSLSYSFTLDIISLFRGEYWKDRSGELKLGFFVIICIMVTVIEYGIVSNLLESLKIVTRN